MDPSVQVALITTGGSLLSSVVIALGAIYFNFKLLTHRIDDLGKRFDKMEATLQVIQNDLKVFYADLARLKDKASIS